MNPQRAVKKAHPKAAVLWSTQFHWWGVFFSGSPYFIGQKSGWSAPDATGMTKKEAWANALAIIEKSRP